MGAGGAASSKKGAEYHNGKRLCALGGARLVGGELLTGKGAWEGVPAIFSDCRTRKSKKDCNSGQWRDAPISWGVEDNHFKLLLLRNESGRVCPACYKGMVQAIATYGQQGTASGMQTRNRPTLSQFISQQTPAPDGGGAEETEAAAGNLLLKEYERLKLVFEMLHRRR